MTPRERITNELAYKLELTKERLKKAERTAEDAKKRISLLENQIQCDHDWEGDGSCMQLETSYCHKCGAIDAV